jgi:hypothetical protein
MGTSQVPATWSFVFALSTLSEKGPRAGASPAATNPEGESPRLAIHLFAVAKFPTYVIEAKCSTNGSVTGLWCIKLNELKRVPPSN